MLMSHLMADTPDELEQTRIALGLPASAKHNAGKPGEHLDVSESRRLMAIHKLGALPVSPRQLVEIIRRRRSEDQITQESLLPDPMLPEPLLHDSPDRRGRQIQIHLNPNRELRISVGGHHFRTENPTQTLTRIRAGERTPPSHVIIGDIVLQPSEARALSQRFREQTD